MSQIALDLLFGVRSLHWEGIPISFTALACRTVTKVKKWKRLNRPSKIKTTSHTIPAVYMLGKKIVAHPKLKSYFERCK